MSQPIDDGGSAFPVAGGCVSSFGMSLRDWLAGQALAAAAHRFDHPHERRELLAQDCYDIADAMLAARLTKPE